jgi:hypothetical protein
MIWTNSSTVILSNFRKIHTEQDQTVPYCTFLENYVVRTYINMFDRIKLIKLYLA